MSLKIIDKYIIALYKVWNKSEKVGEWRSKLRQTLVVEVGLRIHANLIDTSPLTNERHAKITQIYKGTEQAHGFVVAE